MVHLTRPATFAITLLLLLATPSWGVKPAAQLLPDTTCLYVSFPDMNGFRNRFEQTQIGQLARDPVMKPFAEDLGNQLRNRFGDTDIQLGLKWEDLAGVYGGEACLARIQPGAEKGQHATVLLIDVTNHNKQVEKVRETIAANMQQRKAVKRSEKIAGEDVTVYQLPKKVVEPKPREVFLAVIENQFVLVNHLDEMTNLIKRIKGVETEAALRDAKTFQYVMSEVAKADPTAPDARWYIDPFTYAEVIKSSRGKRRRGKDIRQILENQGFDAVRVIGGHVNLSTEDYEFLHRTIVYAPAVTPDPTKFNRAARMLEFPATTHLPIQPWIPRNLATYLSFNWKIRSAFEYSISLIDEIVDSEGFVEDVLKSFETDKGGPMINIRTELLDHLGEHILTFSDYKLPMTTKSERLLVGIEVKDAGKVEKALQKLWEKDPKVEKRDHDGLVIWEIVPEEEDDLELDLPGAVPLPGGDAADTASDSSPLGGPVPNAAMTVARDFLLVSTHIDYLKHILDQRPPHDRLAASADFQVVNDFLNGLGAGIDSFRFFSRTDEEYRSAYEMIRTGKMPESESMLGRVLNRFLGPEEEGVLREQKLDGSKMPSYEIVRRYLGPAGTFVKPRDDGWFVTGIIVSKEKLIDKRAAARDTLTTAQRD